MEKSKTEKRVFFFHYNKPLSKKANKPQISIHYKKQCIIVDNLVCNVKTYGTLQKTQPHFVVKGKCQSITINDRIAYID